MSDGCVLCDLSDEQVHDHLKARKGGPVCDACYEEARALLQEMARMRGNKREDG